MKLEFHGFDSFEGLPPGLVDFHRNWQLGTYACGLQRVRSRLEQWKMPLPYALHKYWYSADFSARIDKQYSLPAPVIAVIDSDLYESATEVLSMLGPRLSIGTILLFDDFNAFAGDDNHGERRATRI